MAQDTGKKREEETDEEYLDLEEAEENQKTKKDQETEAGEKTARIEELEEELEEKEEKIQELKDRVRHLKADFDNYKKRQTTKKDEQVNKEKGELIKDLVPLYDNLDRAFKSFEKNDDKDSFVEGVEKIYAQFAEFLEKREIEPIKAEGEKFDPKKHQALMKVESDDHEQNEITEEFERGYTYKDEVLKPSKVKVNIKPSDSEGNGDN
ncbi:MAG: nucleotide exchange factor GrpE [Candidatus Bipolaricaulota bacterium]|nr:nucleotide exchange factor GrpE [Candidatus Bipolaricaulota bacterium]MBS3792650.1 nucleotide exchange factor GrpE [Candidatus Bipolaricaulota bacterium]